MLLVSENCLYHDSTTCITKLLFTTVVISGLTILVFFSTFLEILLSITLHLGGTRVLAFFCDLIRHSWHLKSPLFFLKDKSQQFEKKEPLVAIDFKIFLCFSICFFQENLRLFLSKKSNLICITRTNHHHVGFFILLL